MKKAINKALGLDGCKNIDVFVKRQITRLKETDEKFSSLFEIMFSVKDNVMFEHTDGNKIFETTYGQCYDKIKLVATNLKRMLQNYQINSIVGLYMDNSIEWIQIFWAILMCGYRPLLMNKRVDKSRLDEVLSSQNVKVVISDEDLFFEKALKIEHLYEETTPDESFKWADEIILMTSGTSLSLKLCVYKGKNICEQIYSTEDIIKRSKLIKTHYEGKIRILTFLPFYHVFGLVACYMWFAFFSRTFVLLRDLSGETILNTIKKHKVTHLFAVPLLWEKIENVARKKIAERGAKLEKKFNKGLKISNALQNLNSCLGRKFAKTVFKEVRESAFGDSIQFLITGGGSVSNSTLELLNGVGYRLANGYGMTEIGITSVELSNKTKWLNSGSVGQPLSTVAYRIENGELLVKGSSSADSIIFKNETMKLDDDWFKTGDLAREKNGHYYIVGRVDDLIVGAGGENICPDEIENKLKIRNAQVVLLALQKEEMTRTTLVVYINKYFSQSKVQEIKQELFSALSKHDVGKLIDDIYYTNDPFMTGNDIKVSRKKLLSRIHNKEMVLKDFKTIDTVVETNLNLDLQKDIAEIFEKTLNKEISPNEYGLNFFYELGGDSLLYFSLVERVKIKYGVSLPLDEESIVSVNGICSYIQDKVN